MSYRVSEDAEQVERERERLRHLNQRADPDTFRTLEALGVGPGWRCLEVGAGSGSVARWLAERVGPSGRVLSIDVDTRFHCDVPPHVEVRRMDVTAEPLPSDAFDLVHARAILQHLHQRERVLDAMVASLRSGGWITVQDSDWRLFHTQPLPDAFAALSRVSLEHTRETTGWDPELGLGLLTALQGRGLVDCEATAQVYTMRGGTSSAEWYVAGLARSAKIHAENGVLTRDQIERGIAEARDPDFAVVSPISVCARGRRP